MPFAVLLPYTILLWMTIALISYFFLYAFGARYFWSQAAKLLTARKELREVEKQIQADQVTLDLYADKLKKLNETYQKTNTKVSVPISNTVKIDPINQLKSAAREEARSRT